LVSRFGFVKVNINRLLVTKVGFNYVDAKKDKI
jgi:hypothetical protein